jgi:hypothetical protein
MLTEYIFPGMCYDQGYMYESASSSGKFMTSAVQTAVLDNSTASTFAEYYGQAYVTANKILNDPKTGWNTIAKNYKD